MKLVPGKSTLQLMYTQKRCQNKKIGLCRVSTSYKAHQAVANLTFPNYNYVIT